MEKKSNNISRAVIVGGGLIGSEMAEMFLSRNIPVTFLVRESGYWNNILPTEESQMINRHLAEHHVELRLNTELKEILSDGHGKARAVLTNKDEEIACGWVGLTAGVKPNIQFLNGSGVNFENGILVNHFFETNVPDIYAIGDCAEFRNALPGRTKLEQVWYTGKMHGETVAHTITGNRLAYQPGPWFNSAKFFDIEYQVYGQIPSTLPNEFETLYWEHPDGRKSIRINWQKDNNEVTGFNLMGIRYRHKVCEKWIMDKRNIHFVLENLSAANCDPEFFARYEQQLINIYNGRYGTNIKLKLAKDLSDMMFIQAERGNIK